MRLTRQQQFAINITRCPYCFQPEGHDCVSRSKAVGTCERPPHTARLLLADRKFTKKIRPVVHFNTGGSLVMDIASGFGNDDHLMEIALDRTEEMRTDLDYEPTEFSLHSWYATLNRDKAFIDGVEIGPSMARKDVLTGQLDRLLTELDKLDALGEDVYEDDTVLFIKYKHNEYQEKAYNYVAFKCVGRWYVTGYQNEGPRNWDKLAEFFSRGVIIEMWMAQGWDRII